MSMDSCKKCGHQVDTDMDDKFYEIETAHGHVTNTPGYCEYCRERMA